MLDKTALDKTALCPSMHIDDVRGEGERERERERERAQKGGRV